MSEKLISYLPQRRENLITDSDGGERSREGFRDSPERLLRQREPKVMY